MKRCFDKRIIAPPRGWQRCGGFSLTAYERFLQRLKMKNCRREAFAWDKDRCQDLIKLSHNFIAWKRASGDSSVNMQIAQTYKSRIFERAIYRRRILRTDVAHIIRVRRYEILQRTIESARTAIQYREDQLILDQIRELHAGN